MKVIETKTFRVSLVIPETAQERADIHRIIEEIEEKTVPRSEWKVVDNRQKANPKHGA